MFQKTKDIDHLTSFYVALFLIHSIWEQVPNNVLHIFGTFFNLGQGTKVVWQAQDNVTALDKNNSRQSWWFEDIADVISS
jgi:hypothetical protein